MSHERDAPTTRDRPGPGSPPGRKIQQARSAKAKFGALVVVCAKCAKRQKVSAKAVGSLLKKAYAEVPPAGGQPKRRKLRVVETGCLGPCPKRAVAVGTAASLAAGRVMLFDLATGRDGARVALLPEFGPIAGLGAAADTTQAGESPSDSP